MTQNLAPILVAAASGAIDHDHHHSAAPLPLLAAAHAQKYLTPNDALRVLDAILQLAVLDRRRTVPPATPSPGDRPIVGPDSEAAWSGREHHVAAWQDSAWSFFAPRALVDGLGRG